MRLRIPTRVGVLASFCLALAVTLPLQSFAEAPARTELLMAVRAGNASRVRALLERRVDVNAATPQGWTPLMEAAQRGDAPVARLLLEAGAVPDARDRVEGTALDVAERAGQSALARLLRAHGARGSGKSTGDRVCVKPWQGEGFCARIQAVEPTRYLLRVDALQGCGAGCPSEADCSAGRNVGGPEGIQAGDAVWVRSWCLTQTGLE